MLATIANAAHAKFCDLPAILFIDLCNRYLKLLAHSCHDRFYYLAFLFQRVASRQVQRNLAHSYYHAASITESTPSSQLW